MSSIAATDTSDGFPICYAKKGKDKGIPLLSLFLFASIYDTVIVKLKAKLNQTIAPLIIATILSFLSQLRALRSWG